MIRFIVSVWLCLLALCAGATAHEVRPAYLVIDEAPAGTFQGRLRQPIVAADGGAVGGLDLKAAFPPHCERQGESAYTRADGYLTERFTVTCKDGLGGGEIAITGLRRSLTDIYATFTDANGQQTNALLNGRQPAFTPQGGGLSNVMGYLRVGIEHLTGGLDHVLFVLGLILLVRKPRRLLIVATAFTIAHSITLALSVLDIMRLPSAPVEAGIALSVLFLAYELSRPSADRASLGRDRPEVMAFGFGLLHGAGFASVLASTGMPPDQVAPALLLFNVGVEIGQIMVIAIFGGLFWVLRPLGPVWTRTYRGAITWVLGIGSVYFFTGAMVNLL